MAVLPVTFFSLSTESRPVIVPSESEPIFAPISSPTPAIVALSTTISSAEFSSISNSTSTKLSMLNKSGTRMLLSNDDKDEEEEKEEKME